MRDIVTINKGGTIREENNIVPHIKVDPTIGSTYERDQAIQYIINN